MSEWFGVLATILAVTGVILNNRKMSVCFYFWMVSNAITAGLHVDVHLWSLVVRDVIFLCLAFEGLIRWKK